MQYSLFVCQITPAQGMGNGIFYFPSRRTINWGHGNVLNGFWHKDLIYSFDLYPLESQYRKRWNIVENRKPKSPSCCENLWMVWDQFKLLFIPLYKVNERSNDGILEANEINKINLCGWIQCELKS